MAIVDTRFIHVDVGIEGKICDAGVFGNCVHTRTGYCA